MKSVNDFEEGYYEVRLAKGAALSPVRFYFGPSPDPSDPDADPMTRDRSHDWQCIVRGEAVTAQKALLIWQSRLAPISKSRYDFLVADLRYCVEHEPDDPSALPYEKIDLNTQKPAF